MTSSIARAALGRSCRQVVMVSLCFGLRPWAAVAQVPSPEHFAIDQLSLRGVRRTNRATIAALLPRDPPGTFAPAEIEELERRLNNLGIFDSVEVTVEGRQLVVSLREKWTIIPAVAFSTGRTAVDTYLSLGATEYNLFGKAAQIGGYASWEERGPNGYLAWSEHLYNPRAGALFAEAFYARSSLRFDTGEAWYRSQAGASAGWQLPYPYGTPLRIRARAYGLHEHISEREGGADSQSGVGLGMGLELSWDRYTWRDLAPSGYELAAELYAGLLVPGDEPRHQGLARATFAVAPTSTTVFTGQVVGELVSTGNANHSLLLGSLRHVRGLADAFYRNRTQLSANLELRQAWRLAERWAVQGALFADAALFVTMDAHGRTDQAARAAGTGAGVRLVPTFLAEIVLRLDGGRLFLPEGRWFLQAALAQYF